eukprot:1146296-Pelagomonas_calceolata.AAC.1
MEREPKDITSISMQVAPCVLRARGRLRRNAATFTALPELDSRLRTNIGSQCCMRPAAGLWSELLEVTYTEPGAAEKVVKILQKKKKRNYVARGNSPYINSGKGDTLAQKSREPPPPQSYKEEKANVQILH